MTIKFLGTSSGWPIPRIGCDCPQCKSENPRDKRLRSCVLINNKVLIDASPDIYQQFIKFGINNIEAILLTHAHPDHILGFHDLSKLPGAKKIPLYCSLESKKILNRNFIMAKFEYRIFKSQDKFKIGNLEVESFPVEHSKMAPTVGLRISSKFKVQSSKLKMQSPKSKIKSPMFVYIPDMETICKKSERYLKNADVLVLDGSTKHKIAFAHMSIPEEIKMVWRLKAKKIYFTHIGHKTGTHKELTKFIQGLGGKRFEVGYDGMEIEFKV